MIKIIQDYYQMFDARTAPLSLSELARHVDMADLKAGLAIGDLRLHRSALPCRETGRTPLPETTPETGMDSCFFLTLGHDL